MRLGERSPSAMIVTLVLPGVNICGGENGGEMLTGSGAAAETSRVHSAPRTFVTTALPAARISVAALTAAALLSAGACSGGDPAAAPATPVVVASSGAPGFFGGTDLAWVEISIAINEQLLPLLDLAPAKSADPGVRTLAAEVKTFDTGELMTLRKLHDQAKLPAQNPHEGMPMPGIVTAEQVAQAAKTSGAGFDSLLLLHLRETFEQGVNLATSETKAGIEPQTLALAKQVLATRAKYLPRVESLGKK
jgi:uncharacterized protein (DUF305 family)